MLQLIGKYLNNTILIVSLLLALIVTAVLNLIPSLANNFAIIEKIEIQGSNFSDSILIEEIIRGYKNKSLINFPLEEYQLKIKKLDWIKRVSIKRKFPDIIHVSIIENLPYAIFIDGINKYLIDDDGEKISFKPDNSKYSELLKVTGSDGNLNFSDLIREININYPKILDMIIEVEFIENRRWNLILKRNIKIKLPEKDSSIQLVKLKQLQQDQKLFNSNIIEIDLREIGRATIKIPGGEELKTGLDEV